MTIPITLTLKQIYEVLCPGCQQKVLDLAAKQANLGVIKDNLKKELEARKEN